MGIQITNKVCIPIFINYLICVKYVQNKRKTTSCQRTEIMI